MAWVLGVAFVLLFAFAVVGFRRNSARLTRKIGTADAQPVMTFRGSMWSLHGGGTRGAWARLEFFDWGIRLRAGALLPVFEVRYDDLIDARLVATRFKKGIRFRSNHLPDPVTFTTAEAAQIADRLEERGVTIDRNVGHLGWLPGD